MLEKLQEFIDFKLKYAEKYGRSVYSIENYRRKHMAHYYFLKQMAWLPMKKQKKCGIKPMINFIN